MTLNTQPLTSDSPTTASEPAAVQTPLPSRGFPRTTETVVVLVLAVVPDIHHAVTSLFLERTTGPIPFPYVASSGLIRSLQVALPVLYILWRNPEPWSAFGLGRVRPRRDVALALLAILLSYLAMLAVVWGLYFVLPDVYRTLYSSYTRPGTIYGGPRFLHDYLLLLLLSAANGFTEELVMRGYLIHRFEQATKSKTLAVIASAALFAAYHVYYGTLGTLYVLVTGLAYGLVYARCRRLWPLALAHAIWDFYGFARIH